MGRGHCTLNVVNGKAYIVMSVSVSVFGQSGAAAAVSDGVLTANELKLHNQALREAIRAGLTLRHGDSPVSFSSMLLNLPKGAHHSTGRSEQLTVMIVAPLTGKAEQMLPIEVKNTLWDPSESHLKLKATITEAGKTIRTETAKLTPGSDQHRFFELSGPKKPTP